jgi:hypothetical protein
MRRESGRHKLQEWRKKKKGCGEFHEEGATLNSDLSGTGPIVEQDGGGGLLQSRGLEAEPSAEADGNARSLCHVGDEDNPVAPITANALDAPNADHASPEQRKSSEEFHPLPLPCVSISQILSSDLDVGQTPSTSHPPAENRRCRRVTRPLLRRAV